MFRKRISPVSGAPNKLPVRRPLELNATTSCRPRFRKRWVIMPRARTRDLIIVLWRCARGERFDAEAYPGAWWLMQRISSFRDETVHCILLVCDVTTITRERDALLRRNREFLSDSERHDGRRAVTGSHSDGLVDENRLAHVRLLAFPPVSNSF